MVRGYRDIGWIYEVVDRAGIILTALVLQAFGHSLSGGALMNRIGQACLKFDPKLNEQVKEELRCGLSAAIQIGNTLWVANDETISLERLSYQGTDDKEIHQYGQHTQFSLDKYLALPVPPTDGPGDKWKFKEVDMEGLDIKDGYLWLVGSHSLTRHKADSAHSSEKNFEHLAKVSSNGNRFLLARVPLVEKDETYTLEKEVVQAGGEKHVAAQLCETTESSSLIQALQQDDHLRDFLKIPSKDNGFDIEGLAVAGDRVFIGLRGPVLRGHAVVLELELEVNKNSPSELKLRSFNSDNPKNPTYRKHFLDLCGLGVRDLCIHGNDLLILAGPTMCLDGPASIFRWRGGAQPAGESVVFGEALTKVGDVPRDVSCKQGEDHAEGMTLFSPDDGEANSVLIVYDSTSKSREAGESGIKADIFHLAAHP
jgi:hypothetical protein